MAHSFRTLASRLPGLGATACACFAMCLNATPLRANCSEDAMIVFDGSGSMAEMGFNMIDEPRIFEARRALKDVMPKVAPHRRIGLIVYGPAVELSENACAGVDLRFAPRADAANVVIEAIEGLQPEGNTALTDSVALAAEVLQYKTRPGTIVLVSDGKETCGGTPCTLVQDLVRDSARLTVHVIGFKVRSEHFGWPGETGGESGETISVAKCLATQTGGHYVNAETVEDLVDAMNRMLGCNLLF